MSLLLSKLIRELLAREAFVSLADLTDALKFRCAQLRIHWTPDDITRAIQLVGSNRRLI